MRRSQPLPIMTDAGLDAASAVTAVNQNGDLQQGDIAAERPLTIYLNKRELVTLMTLGTQPESLVLGWLRNQRLVSDIAQVRSIQIDWETDSAAVVTAATSTDDAKKLERRLGHRTVTTGCGQGTVFGNRMNELDGIRCWTWRFRPPTHKPRSRSWACVQSVRY